MKDALKALIEALYPMNACLLGEGYDNRLEYLKSLLELEVIEFPSGTQLSTWTVPDEWVVRDAWVKFNGEKILDYKTQPLSLVVGSLPFQGKVTHEELAPHIHHGEGEVTPYIFKFYEKDWGFTVPKDFLVTEGEYEVFIDTEYRPGTMKLGIHTVKGKSDREILLFAHLDHPFQANDNLSGVACLLDVARNIKADHTIKIIFCPETIGSQAYALTQDLSKVDFVIAVDICGNTGPLLFQMAFDSSAKINKIAHVAIQNLAQGFVKGKFRASIGSDEYPFNDPTIGIPGIMLSRHPYPEYHTADDTPDKIDYEAILNMSKVVCEIIKVYEEDFVPIRNYTGPVMRSRFELQTPSPQLNLSYDYFFYSMDGKKSVAELCHEFGVNINYTLEALRVMEYEGFIRRADSGEGAFKPPAKQKHERVQRKADVPRKRRKVS